MTESSNAFSGNWDEFEKEQSRDYIGQVVLAEVREVPPERYLEWSKPPHEGVTPLELHLVVKPLDHQLIRHNRAGEEVDYFDYEIGMTQPDGKLKRKNSGIGVFREQARKLGFPDPTTLAGRTFAISETTQSFGGGFTGRVTLLTQHLRDGYTHQGELPLWDFRKKDAQDMPETVPVGDVVNTSTLSEETAQALSVSLEGVKADDTSAINNAGRRVGQAAIVRSLQYNEELIPTLVEMGVIKVTKGVIHGLPVTTPS